MCLVIKRCFIDLEPVCRSNNYYTKNTFITKLEFKNENNNKYIED